MLPPLPLPPSRPARGPATATRGNLGLLGALLELGLQGGAVRTQRRPGRRVRVTPKFPEEHSLQLGVEPRRDPELNQLPRRRRR